MMARQEAVAIKENNTCTFPTWNEVEPGQTETDNKEEDKSPKPHFPRKEKRNLKLLQSSGKLILWIRTKDEGWSVTWRIVLSSSSSSCCC
jgi:hypothetical protein